MRVAPRRLSPRELEVLTLLAGGLQTREIAEQLIITPATVKNHLRNIYARMVARNRTEAVALAYQYGVLGREMDA